MDGIALLTIFVLAVFVGFEVVSKVSTTLHTPLMSGANAIHGVILVGVDHRHRPDRLDRGAGARAAVGGARDGQHGGRFRGDRPDAGDVQGPRSRPGRARPVPTRRRGGRAMTCCRRRGPRSVYLVAAVCFILALKGLSSPGTARRGNLIGAGGAVLAVLVAFLSDDLRHVPLILAAIAVGYGARRARGPAGGDDPDAAAGGAVQRGRWRRGRPRRRAGAAGDASGMPGGASTGSASIAAAAGRVHRAGRRGLVLRVLRDVRQAAGADDHPAGDVPRRPVPLRRQPRRRRRARRRRGGRRPGRLHLAGCCWCCSPWSRCWSACCSCCRSAAPTCRSSSRCSTPSPA